MPFENIPGAFGSDIDRKGNNRHSSPRPENNRQTDLPFYTDLRRIRPERWVDIICGSLIVAFLIAVLCTWSAFSRVLFENLLFPIIYIGSKIVTYGTMAAVCIGGFFGKIKRRFHWW